MKALALLVQSASWKGSLHSSKTWVQNMQRQLAKDLRTIAQAQLKGTPPKWLAALHARPLFRAGTLDSAASAQPSVPSGELAPSGSSEKLASSGPGDAAADDGDEGSEESEDGTESALKKDGDDPAFEMMAPLEVPAPATPQEPEPRSPRSPEPPRRNPRLHKGRVLAKEFTDVVLEPGPEDDSAKGVKVRFPDNMVVEIAEMPISVYVARKMHATPQASKALPPSAPTASSPVDSVLKRPSASQPARSSAVAVDSKVLPDGRQARISIKKDHHLLLMLSIGGQPMLYVRESVEGSYDIMRHVLAKLMSNEVQAEKMALRKLRDSMIPGPAPKEANMQRKSSGRTETIASLPSNLAVSCPFAAFDEFMGSAPSG